VCLSTTIDRRMSFASLRLLPPIVQAVVELEYDEPTEVQLEVIPNVLMGRDVWASARTGSGKTAAFVLPMLHALSVNAPPRERAVRALIVAPTRELAVQIGEAVESYGAYLAPRPRTCVVVGGISINPQMLALRGGADIVIGTPGRILDLVAKNAMRLGVLEILVLDEADRLFALGFEDELARIFAEVPDARQTLLFSATLPRHVQMLCEAHLRDPVRINIDAGGTPTSRVLVQRAIEVDACKRTMLLRHLLDTEGWAHALVFVASRIAAERVASKLVRAKIMAKALHGEMSQGARSLALAELKTGNLRVLVATDVAARGLDIEKLPVVVNYDLPRSPIDYLHRIGRTARAGEHGVAVSFVTADSEAHFRLIARRHHLTIAREQIAGFEPIEKAVPVRDTAGGIKGKRKSKKDKLREISAADAATRESGSEG
jgi:ATP-dependent RNA helicase RhlE